MNEKRILNLSTIKMIMKFFFILILITVVLLCTFITVHLLSSFSSDVIKGFIGIGFLVLNCIMIYYFGLVIILFYKYYSFEKNREITLETNAITIIDKNNYTILTSENLISIEYNLSTLHSKNLLSEYEFVKFYTIDGNELIVTNFILNSSLLENILPGVKRKIKLNKVNYL